MNNQTDFGSIMDHPFPAAPSVASITYMTNVVRHVFSLLAGIGVGTGLAMDDAKLTVIATALLTVGSALLWAGAIVWSWYQTWKSNRDDHAASVASAAASAQASVAAGQPVVVVVPPPPAVS
jgi:hypothetical protein